MTENNEVSSVRTID